MNANNFKRFLDKKNCLKIICGAGNKNLREITNLCALYAVAGCRFFDVNASVEAIKAAKEGLKYAGKQKSSFICVSVGTKNDPHFLKCSIDRAKCTNCGYCEKICPQKAVIGDKEFFTINPDNCIGCQKCVKICNNKAIKAKSEELPLSEIIPSLLKEGFDCLEYHIVTDNEHDIINGWNTLTKIYNGPVSICLDRSKFGNEKINKYLREMKVSYNNLFIIQADGAPMSGGEDDFGTTLQAVATADIIDKFNISPYIFISGGTNSKTKELAKLCGIETTGISIGSFARKIVREYIENDNFLTDKKIFNEALEIAKRII